MKKAVFLFLFLCNVAGFSQTIEDVETLKKEYQECLDSEENRVACSFAYYDKTNELFDKVFRRVRERATPTERKKLKDNQLLWLKGKATYFDKVYKNTAAELGTDEGDEFRMIVNAKKADYVNIRTLELIKQLE